MATRSYVDGTSCIALGVEVVYVLDLRLISPAESVCDIEEELGVPLDSILLSNVQ